jgi:septum formation protein
MKLVLASASPRRRQMMDELGIPYVAVAPRFEELPRQDLSPEAEARLFAYEKAKSVVSQFPGALIIGSDTLIACEGRKIGKPVDAADACAMLAFLCGRTHRIYTAVSVLNTVDGRHTEHLETIDVTMRSASPKEIADYVATGEPLDKAGAYAIQGAGKSLIAEIRGDYWAAVGLPQGWVKAELMKYGLPESLAS